MNERELIQAANSGDVAAIENYSKYLLQNKEWTDAQEWLLKGAHAGSYYCMINYAHITIAMVEATINISTAEALNCMNDLNEAEKWAIVVRDAGKLGNDNVLGSTHGIYSEMVWCNYLIALKTGQAEYYHAVVSNYSRINDKPSSRVTYAYIKALEELGEAKKAFDVSMILVNDYDDTLKDFMLEVIYGGISEAFFKGEIVQADYNQAYQYVQKAGKVNPDNELLQYFNSGAAKRDFDNAHPTRTTKSSGGCYVATAVYGSYDCPEVWTLRRFRDNTLAETWYGRAFIRVYYAVSPKLVKWFGNAEWFKKLWKPALDHMVEKLNERGVQNIPYDDRAW